ncbi:MAG: magnesium transporter [Gammaproteobacteria bacterium]|nr:magnesium transporter [Gammaproteobacteria bacterium]
MAERTQPWATQTPTTRLNRGYCRRYPDEVAEFLSGVPADEGWQAIQDIPIGDSTTVWTRLPTDAAEAILAHADDTYLGDLFNRLDPVYAASVLRRADPGLRARILARLSPAVGQDLERLMGFPENSAGSLMDPRTVTLRGDMTAREALERLRRDKPRFTHHLFVVDRERRLQGMVEIEALALAESDEPVDGVLRPVRMVVTALEHRDELLEKLDRHGISDVPVTDQEGHLIGVIHHDQLFGAVQEDSSGDIQAMFGASRDERALSDVSFAVRKRLPWLHINLLTAFLAASVVGLFEHTIAQFTALAVLLPVVAGQSGNAGAQALAVTMRGLALREIGTRHLLRVVVKEVSAGMINGLLIALTTAVGVFVWSGSAGLALVIALAMVLSMAAAGLAGASIPIALTAAGQDPAQSSSIILTTITDVVGFLSFLGIATLLSGLL